MDVTSKVEKLLDANRLREAFKILTEQCAALKLPGLIDKINTTENTYRYMIHYLVEGTTDTNRESLHADMKEQIRDLAYALERQEKVRTSPEAYFAECRILGMHAEPLQSLWTEYEKQRMLADVAADTRQYNRDLERESEELLQKIFATVWTRESFSKEELDKFQSTLRDNNADMPLRSQLISALLLNQLQYFSKDVLKCLLLAYSDDQLSDEIAARLMVAILIILRKYPERIRRIKNLNDCLETWNDNLITYQRLRTAIMALVRTFDTDRINAKMKDEVIPEIIKLQPEIMKRFKSMPKEMELTEMDMNPEWEELMKKNGLQDKLMEMQEIQMEGGDVMMLAFSNLKNFPFFHNLSNWFLPFSRNYSQLDAFREIQSESLDLFLGSDVMICNSDKYSFALSMGLMPKEQKEHMLAQFDSQIGQVKEEMKSAALKSSRPEFDAAIVRYVRDLYRFFRLYKRRQDFYDPFAEPFDFTSLPVIGEGLVDDDTLRLVGEFYFKHGYYKNAMRLFIRISDSEAAEEQLLEKIGYCYQSLGDLSTALDYYRRAELMNPQSKWLKRKLAYMYRVTSQYEEAAKYYRMLTELEPEKTSYLMNLANSLLETGEREEALKLYYKVNYLDEGNENAWRAIAWTELLNGNMEKSRDYFSRILLMSPTPEDYLNAGHRALVAKEYKEAISLYKQALKGDNNDWEKFFASMKEDYPTLERLGVDLMEVPILIDKMKYDLE